MLNLLWELVRKDLRIFVADRKSVMISFVTPVVLACFIGYLYQSTGKPSEPKRVSVLLVDQDKSEFTKDLIERLDKSGAFDVKSSSEAAAKRKVSHGDVALAIVIPSGFSDKAIQAMSQHSDPPSYRFLVDPSKAIEVGMAKGSIMRVTMQALTKQVYGNMAPIEDSQMPFKISEESQAAPNSADTSPCAHAFAGMGMQGLLFWAIESAMTLLREKKLGLWKRLRSSPVSPTMFLLGKGISSMIRAFVILCVVFGMGFLVFHFQIMPTVGNYVGFGLIALSASLMAATFGLFVAALGRTEEQSRGLSILAVLGMCMLGGAWFPLSFLPQFMQTLSKAVPISWAVDGFDGMIWRNGGFGDALTACAVLVGFSLLFGLVALKRSRWEPEAA